MGLRAPLMFALDSASAPPCSRQTSLMNPLAGTRMPASAPSIQSDHHADSVEDHFSLFAA